MKHTYLHDVLPFLRELEREKQKQFETYFRTAPLWLMDLFQSEVMEAGITFIRENEPADTIFFVARGRVKATDYRVSGIAYDFMKRFLSQSFSVAEQFTGMPGQYVPLKETLRGFKMILNGECDSIPESCFLFTGTIDDVFEKAKNNQNQ